MTKGKMVEHSVGPNLLCIIIAFKQGTNNRNKRRSSPLLLTESLNFYCYFLSAVTLEMQYKTKTF